MRRVVSISLGSSKRDKKSQVEILGERFEISREGTDGDWGRFRRRFEELDGQVDALGIGGADLYLVSGERKYTFQQVARAVSGVMKTPVADGSGLKHTLERRSVQWLQENGVVDFAQERVLLVSAVDRYGLAQSLDALCPQVVYGDLLFGLGLPFPVRSYAAVQRIARVALPIVTRLPIEWLYPTGKKQETRQPRFAKWFDWATFVCGDWHYIRKYSPDRMPGKTVMSQTFRTADLELLRNAGVARAIATTPVVDGESFATNVMEGVILALLGKTMETATEADYLEILDRLNWHPTLMAL